MLEHVDDLDRVLAETSRVLKPGGIYMYDTINRTRRSKLVRDQADAGVALDGSDGAEPARLGHVHQAAASSTAAMARAGLENRDTVGIGPARNPVALVIDMRRRARGDMTYGEFGARNKFRETRDTVAALRRLRPEAP